MSDKTYIVRSKPPETSMQPVRAASAEVEDDYMKMAHCPHSSIYLLLTVGLVTTKFKLDHYLKR